MTIEEAYAAIAANDAAAKDAAYAVINATFAVYDAAANDAAESQPKGIIWDSEPETRCDCGNVCTNCGGPGHM